MLPLPMGEGWGEGTGYVFSPLLTDADELDDLVRLELAIVHCPGVNFDLAVVVGNHAPGSLAIFVSAAHFLMIGLQGNIVGIRGVPPHAGDALVIGAVEV